jgi:hypothetical protein
MKSMDDNREKLRELTEKIQIGDSDEGAEALQEIIGMVRDPGTTREDVRAALREEYAESRLKRENSEALTHFAQRFPQLNEKPLLADAAKRAIQEELITDLKGAGASDEQLAPVREDIGRLVQVHGQARLGGAKLRSPKEIVDASGNLLIGEFGLKPARRSGTEYLRDLRTERGLPVREQDPAGAQAERRGDAYGDAASLEARQARVRQMRIDRGFPVHGR